MEFKRIKPVRLVALDLDGTLLREDQTIGERTQKALVDAMESGTHIVIATGRPVGTLPEAIKNIEGVQYAITANGTRTINLKTGECMHTKCFAPEVAKELLEWFRTLPYMIEIFVDGKAYTEAEKLKNPEMHGIVGKSVEYVLRSRIQLDDLYGFAFENIDKIENINFHFGDMDAKAEMWAKLNQDSRVTATSSFGRLLEVSGENASKASAILSLADILGVDHGDIMACGDSYNDMAMLEVAAVAVAMGNAKNEVKEMADFITADNENDGVGVAIEKFALNL